MDLFIKDGKTYRITGKNYKNLLIHMLGGKPFDPKQFEARDTSIDVPFNFDNANQDELMAELQKALTPKVGSRPRRKKKDKKENEATAESVEATV